MEVGIYVDDGVVAYLCAHISVLLHRILADARHIFGCIVFRKPPDVAAEVAFQYLGYLKPQVEVAIEVEFRQGQDVVVA